MRAFLVRYLPASERRTTLWLVLGQLVVGGVAHRLDRMILRDMTTSIIGQPVSPFVIMSVQMLAEFAIVAWLVALLIRFARAPKALALYVFAAELAGIVLGLVILLAGKGVVALITMQMSPEARFDPVWQLSLSSLASTLPSLAIGLGAVAGAWIAATVSLARIQDAGFSGDDSESHRGLRRKPGPIGWGFMGWEGRPMAGDALIAVSFVAVTVIPSVASDVGNLAVALVPGAGESGYPETPVFVVLLMVSAIAWYASANLVTRRLGTVALWMVPAGALVGSAIYVLGFAASQPRVAPLGSIATINLLPQLIAIAAALLGSAHALRAKPATLSASDQQAPGAQAPDDIRGGGNG